MYKVIRSLSSYSQHCLHLFNSYHIRIIVKQSNHVKERWDEIDRERQRIAANPAPPAEMRGNLRDKYESEWHRGDNTHFPEEYLPALESDPEVLYWWIELLAEREIRRQGYRGYPISIQGNFNRVYNAWKERQNWVR